MSKEHRYNVDLVWTGNTGSGTADYRSYQRGHILHVQGKPEIYASSDPSFRGDPTKYNPEELLVASLSGCHMLWYLHLCAESGIVVVEYTDKAVGLMEETANGGGRFKEVVLNPTVLITDISRSGDALELHARASEKCFIANSVNFPVHHRPEIKRAG